MTRRRRVTGTVVAIVAAVVVVAGAAAATVTAAVPARAVAINGTTIVVVVAIIVIVIVGKVLEERRRRCRRRPMMDDVLNTGGVRKGVLRGTRALEEVQGWRLRLDLHRRQDRRRRHVVRLQFHVGLRAQHVRVLRVQLLDARRDVLPERRPEEHVVVLTGARWLTPGGDEAGLRRPAHRRGTADLEEVLHVHRRRFPRVSRVRFILIQPL